MPGRGRSSERRGTRSQPFRKATACAIVVALTLPFTPIAQTLGFSAVPARFIVAMAVIVVLYIAAAEGAKRWFYSLPLFRP